MLALTLIMVGLVLRLLTHGLNFTPIAAIALFSAVYLNKKYSLLVPLALIILSDIIIGLHNVIFFTWASFALIAIIGLWIKKHKSFTTVISGSLVASFVFYLVSNFGVWLMGWYPPTLEGLVRCYVLALPFFRNFTISTLAYTLVFFGLYELIARSIKDPKLSKVLLTSF